MAAAFEIVSEKSDAAKPVIKAPAAPDRTAAINTLLLLLKTLSQRTVVALADLRTVLSAAAAFYLWCDLPAEPSPGRLIALGMFALFILVINWIWRR